MNTNLPKHLTAEVTPIAPAKVRRPQVRKQRFSRTPKQAARQDGVDTSVRKAHVHWTEVAMSDCEAGCKVYESDAGVLRAFHNSAYGCRKDVTVGERVEFDDVTGRYRILERVR